MSIIAEALKKAQRKGGQRVAAPPPFDLKKEDQPRVETEVKRPPVIAQPAKKAAAPTVTGAPRAVPVAEKAAAAKKGAPRVWSFRIPIIFAAILFFFGAVIFVINKIYLPALDKNKIIATPAERQPAARIPQAQPPESSGKPTKQAEETPAVPGGTDKKAAPEVASKEGIAPEEIKAVAPPPEVEKKAEEKPVLAPESKQPALAKTGGQEKPLSRETGAQESAGGTFPLEEQIEPSKGFLPPVEQPMIVEGEKEKATANIVQKDHEKEQKLREDIYHFNMAVYFQRKNDFNSALAEYAKVIELSPYNAEVYSNMGVLYNQIGEYEQAVAVLQKALLINPLYSKAHNNLGLAYYKSGQLEQAQKHLLKAIELEPANLESYNNLGLLYKKLDEPEKAEQIFSRALAINPGYTAAHYNLALLLDETGQLERAIRHYRAFIDNGGGSPELNEKVKTRLANLTETRPAQPAQF